MPAIAKGVVSGEGGLSDLRAPLFKGKESTSVSSERHERRSFIRSVTGAFVAATLSPSSILGGDDVSSERRDSRRGEGPLQIITLPKNNGELRALYGGKLVQDLLDHWTDPVTGAVASSAIAAIKELKDLNFLPTTYVHELVHKIQAHVGIRYGLGTQFERKLSVPKSTNSAAAQYDVLSTAPVYLGQGRVAFIPTPENVSLRQLAQFIPASLRNDLSFRSYVTQPALLDRDARKFHDVQRPTSHLIDEFSSSHLGAELAFECIDANVEFNRRNQPEGRLFEPKLEILGLFTLALGVLAAEKDVRFLQPGDEQQFFSGIRFLVERSLWLNSKIAKSSEMNVVHGQLFRPGEILRTFLHAEDCKDFRGQVKDVFGPKLYQLLSADPFGDVLAPVPDFQEIKVERLRKSVGG